MTPPGATSFRIRTPGRTRRRARRIRSRRPPTPRSVRSRSAFTDLIGLTLGARVTQDKKDYFFTWYPYEYFPHSTTGATTTLTRISGLPLSSDYAASRDDTLFTGKAQLDFHVSKDFLAYAGINRGVKGGGYTAPLFPLFINDLSKMTFNPEKLTSYEAGFKSEYLDHRCA